MSLTPEQFEAKLITARAELLGAFQGGPTDAEVFTKAIMDYQYMATIAIFREIHGMNTAEHNRWQQTMNKLKELEDKIDDLRERQA